MAALLVRLLHPLIIFARIATFETRIIRQTNLFLIIDHYCPVKVDEAFFETIEI